MIDEMIPHHVANPFLTPYHIKKSPILSSRQKKKKKQTVESMTEQSGQTTQRHSDKYNIQSDHHFSLASATYSLEPSRNNNNNSCSRRRRRRKDYVLVRLGILLIVAYFTLLNVLSIIYKIVSILFGFFIHTVIGRRMSSAASRSHFLDKVFVQNAEEIRRLLELAKAEFEVMNEQSSSSTHYSQLHSVRGEEKIGYFEQIVHPGDKAITFSVPKFYASSINGETIAGGQKTFRQLTLGKLLTPELAGMIGGVVPEENEPNISVATSFQKTIFVSIISKDDSSRCSHTVSNLLDTSANPERIRVAVVHRVNPFSKGYLACDSPPKPCNSDPDQLLCKYNANVDVYEMNLELDAGATFARHIGQRMYRGEYYALQIGLDAGIVFSERWDEELVRQFEATKNEMAVITTYLSETKMRDGNRSAKPERYTICHASFQGHGSERRLEHLRFDQIEQSSPPGRTDSPMLQPFWSSEFSFSRGHFVLQIPYDPQYCGLDEQDEEVGVAFRAFSSGYDFYTPTQSVVFRTKPNLVRDELSLCTSKSKNKSRKHLYSLIGLGTNHEDTIPQEYGLGAVREITKFFTLFGIHASEKVTEDRLCEFVVTGNMHDEFAPHLRHDGMGIDYSQISFRFHELISIHKDRHE